MSGFNCSVVYPYPSPELADTDCIKLLLRLSDCGNVIPCSVLDKVACILPAPSRKLIVPFDTNMSFQAFVALPKLKLDVVLTPSVAGMIEPDIWIEPDIVCSPMNVFEPVVANELTSTGVADPVSTVISKVVASPFVNVMVLLDTDAVTSNEPVSVLPPPPPLRAYDAVKA